MKHKTADGQRPMAAGRSGSVRELLFQVGHDVRGRCAGAEQPAAALLVQLLHVFARDDAAADRDAEVIEEAVTQYQTRAQYAVRSKQAVPSPRPDYREDRAASSL